MSSTYQSFFKYSACKGSKAATEYFFRKLTDKERDTVLFRTLCAALERDMRSYLLRGEQEKPRSDVLCYLLSLMTHEQRMKVFKKHPSSCLMCFLDWPWHDLFLDISDLIWNFLPKSRYDHVLDTMRNNILNLNLGYYFPDLFQKFFMRSPSDFRKYFVDRECMHYQIPFFCKFIYVEDAETIKIVLRNLDSCDKVRLLSGHKFFKLLSFLVEKEKWHLVELCIGEAMRSKEDWEILKKVYMDQTTWCRGDRKWKRFFELLDGTGVSASVTKCSEDETLTKAKRISSEEEAYDLTKKHKRH
ncbi:hypothetical protein AVEN_71301-1 [Araneus ventricosus]|uniref:Uncharacterized protein n=1 Tax=Araneus ventricosus TaxID=182803 RepID=A0A4Y2P5A6_ARAVE|nr:hypothetical protein AVEN_71301-1 [Araneus ventricosus]